MRAALPSQHLRTKMCTQGNPFRGIWVIIWTGLAKLTWRTKPWSFATQTAITIHTWSACLIVILSLNIDKSSGDAFHILSTTLWAKHPPPQWQSFSIWRRRKMIIYPDDGLFVYWKHADTSESTNPSMAPGSLPPFLTQKNQRKLGIFQTSSVTFKKG